jgi:hypothetical protein
VLRIRVSQTTLDQVTALAEAWHQPLSTVVKDAVADLLHHPERYRAILAARRPIALDDDRLPQQQANWERDRGKMEEACDLSGLLASMRLPGA